MEIINIDEKMKNEWEQYIANHPYSIAWHSYDWSAVVKKHYKVDFYPIAAFDNNKICGILPLYLVKDLSGKTRLISVPYAVAGGIIADSEVISKKLVEKAIDLLQEHKSLSITFKQYKVKLNGNLKNDENYYNKELDLTQGTETLWNDLSENNKRKIAKTEKYICDLECPSQDLNGFFRLLVRHHHLMGIPCVSKRWIEDLVVSRMYTIALLKHQNAIVAGTLVKVFKKTVSFPFSSLPDNSEQSNLFAYRLYWELIIKFAAEGMQIFHSGRIPKSDETNEYRLGWGGTKYNYFYQYYPGDVGAVEFAKKRGKKRDIVASIWKRLPVSITRFLGPLIVKQYP
jgi:serine/alanine adding enzyme